VTGSSAKKSLAAVFAGGVGLGGTWGGRPVICPCIECPDVGGDKLAADMFEEGMGRGGPVLVDMLLVRGGGGVVCAD
jgi:hypothetical protein